MLRSLTCGMLLIGLGVLSGCGDSGAGNAVAIVDLDKVIKMTGVDIEINNAVQARELQLRNGLSEFEKQLNQQYLDKKEEFGEEPNEEQAKELQMLLGQVQAQFQQARGQANQNISTFQQQLFEGFQQKVSPICLEIAQEKGFSIVLGKNPSVLAFDTTIDITDAVTERLEQLKQEGEGTAGDTPATPGTNGLPMGTESTTPITPPLMPATEKPVTEKPATEKPVTEKPMTEKPADGQTTSDKPDATKPAAEAEKPAAKPDEAEKPANTEAPAEPAAEKPATEKPATEPEAKADAESDAASETKPE